MLRQDTDHLKTAQRVWELAREKGDIYEGKYEGWYNVREETYVTEDDARQTDYKDPASGKPLEKKCEECYFFKMGRYQAAAQGHAHASGAL